MARRKSPVARELIEARGRLDAWRRARTTRAMPAELWDLAAELGARHGVSPTSVALGLRYDILKRRVLSRRTVAGTRRPTFVEIARPSAASCRVEVEDGRGGRMRVELVVDPLAALETLGRALLGGRG
jgi:hypothetical protein